MLQKLEKKAKSKKWFDFLNTSMSISWKEGARVDKSDEGSVNICLHSKYFLTFFYYKDNIKCKKQKKNPIPKYTAQWLTTKWTVIWPRNIRFPEPLIQCNYFPYSATGFCHLNMDPKNYVLVCLLLNVWTYYNLLVHSSVNNLISNFWLL